MTIFIGGGVFWDTSDLDSMTIFIGGGVILGQLRFGLYNNFHLGGVFWDTSDLDSLTIFILGGGEGSGRGRGYSTE